MSKNVKLCTLQLSKNELVHLRDLFSVAIDNVTVSQTLSIIEQRKSAEALLWKKISKLCSDMKIPLDTGAPDYHVVVESMGIAKKQSKDVEAIQNLVNVMRGMRETSETGSNEETFVKDKIDE